jgi:2-C-methyl-D-erythritol 4-phosphate cytidylyltransferase
MKAKLKKRSTQSSHPELITNKTAVIVAAAGRGERLGSGIPKALFELQGRTLIDLALDKIVASGVADEIVVVAPELFVGDCEKAVGSRAEVVVGGPTRRASVFAGLAAVGDVKFVMVHDAARALTPPEVFRRVKEALESGAIAVVPVMPVADTLKRVTSNGLVSETLDRNHLFLVQTPQGFLATALRDAHETVPDDVIITDDASMIEWCGGGVKTVAGSYQALKITEQSDIELAAALLSPSVEASK